MRLPALKSSKRLHGRPWFWRLRRNVKRWVRHGFRPPAKPVKVFCVGWLKTATTSTGRALEVLGYRHLSFQLDLHRSLNQIGVEGLLRVAKRYDSFDDLPWNKLSVLPALVEAFPDAKFILTNRNPERWLSSYKKYFQPTGGKTDQELLALFSAHNRQAAKILDQAGVSWIEIDVEGELNWETLCPFLGEPIPEVSFPRVNTLAQHRSKQG